MNCVACGKQLSPRESACPVCFVDNGAPNVRQADAATEKSELDSRVQTARDYCAANGLNDELKLLEDTASYSRAVMTRSYSDVIRLLESNLNFYVGFAIQVDSGMRLPRENSLDSVRRQWENAIFPNYADKILFASLSVNERGLRNYGGADIVLHEFAVARRATVFECNGLDFGGRLRLDQTVPHGLRATWKERAKVVIAKLYSQLTKGFTVQQIDDILQVDAGGGANDDFVEVHVFGGVNHDAFEKVLARPRDIIEQQGWDLAMSNARIAGITTVTRP